MDNKSDVTYTKEQPIYTTGHVVVVEVKRLEEDKCKTNEK